MNIQELYQKKLISAQDLAERVENGWVLGMDAAPTQTDAIVSAVCERAKSGVLTDVTVHTMLDSYPFAFYADASFNGKVNGVSWFSGGGARKAIAAGYADYIPNYYRDTMKLIRDHYAYDAFCVSVSPMDKHGYFSLATTSSYSEAMISKAKRIFIEVNSFQPRAVCNTQLHISQVDAIVENSHPLPVLPPVKLDETSITIGNSGYYTMNSSEGGMDNMTKLFLMVDICVAVVLILLACIVFIRYAKKQKKAKAKKA